MIPFERLQVMIAALEAGPVVDDAMRAEIADALDSLYVAQILEGQKHRRGRPSSVIVEHTARVALVLVEQYRVPVKVAILAAAPGAGEKLFETIAREYRKERDAPRHWWISDTEVEKAAERLPPRARIAKANEK